MDIRDTLHDRVREQPVDELHHRRFVDLRLERGDRGLVLFLLDELEILLLEEVPEEVPHLLFGGTIVLLEMLADGELAHDHGLDRELGDEAEVVDRRRSLGLVIATVSLAPCLRRGSMRCL